MNVIIMRGLPGAGKSTWIKQQFGEEYRRTKMAVCSADDYHMLDGKYAFKIENAGKAHGLCLKHFLLCLDDNQLETVVIDNTNTQLWEIAPYYAVALAHAIECQVVRVHCSFEDACRRNVHDVPPSTIWRMHQTLTTERLPAHWREEIVLP